MKLIKKLYNNYLLIDLLKDVENIFIECNHVGWDGYNAPRSNRIIYDNAILLLKNFSINKIIYPELIPCNEELDFEWYINKENQIVLIIYEKDFIGYAGLINGKKLYGRIKVKNYNKIPKFIINLLIMMYKGIKNPE